MRISMCAATLNENRAGLRPPNSPARPNYLGYNINNTKQAYNIIDDNFRKKYSTIEYNKANLKSVFSKINSAIDNIDQVKKKVDPYGTRYIMNIGGEDYQSFPESLRALQEYQGFVYGILLLIVIVALPGGLYGGLRDIYAMITGKNDT